MAPRNMIPLVLVVVIILVGAFFAVQTFVNSGPSAVAQMDPDERLLLAKTEQLHRGMSREDVVAILGPPDEDPLGFRPKWCLGNCLLNVLAVYIFPSGAQKVVWISIGRFVYERVL